MHTALSGQSREQTTLEGMSGVPHLEGLLGRPVWESFGIALFGGALFWMPFLGNTILDGITEALRRELSLLITAAFEPSLQLYTAAGAHSVLRPGQEEVNTLTSTTFIGAGPHHHPMPWHHWSGTRACLLAATQYFFPRDLDERRHE